jgi:hypothetical protein
MGPERMSMSTCALGFVAKTGKAAAVAIGPGPELLGKWDLVLVPPGQERFVYHAAAQRDGDAARWVRASTKAIARETQHVIDALLEAVTARVTAAAIVGRSLELDLPLTEILAAHTRLHTAEGVLYRSVIVDALHEHGIDTTLVPPDQLGDNSVLARLGKVPPPWRREHKDAALAALGLLRPGRAGDRGPGPRSRTATRPRRRT